MLSLSSKEHTLQSLHLNAMFNHIVSTDEMLLKVVLDGCAVVTIGALEWLLPSVSPEVTSQVRSEEEPLWAVGALVAGPKRVSSQRSGPHRRLPSTALKYGTPNLGDMLYG